MSEFDEGDLPLLEAGEWWRWYPSADAAVQALATMLRKTIRERDEARAAFDTVLPHALRNNGEDQCPACFVRRDADDDGIGHREGCAIAAVIRARGAR